MSMVRPPGPLSALGLAVIVLTLAVDQGSKALALATLPFAERIPLLPILDLYLVFNPGIAFSFLAGFGGLALIGLTLAITVAVLVLWWRSHEGGRWAAVGYALIVGGALGNLVDRFVHGHVVDFLLLHFGAWTPFVFNLADVALSLGPAILIVIFAWPKRG